MSPFDISHQDTLGLAIGDVEGGSLRRATGRTDDPYSVSQRRRRASGNDDMGAGLCKSTCHLETQTAAAAGHQRHLTRQ